LRRCRVGLSRGRGRRKEGGGERLTGGAQSSAIEGKRKGDGGTGPLREGAGGPAGRLGRREKGILFFFQTLFKTNFSFQIQNKILLNFSQNFIIFLEATQATKNHAKPKDDAQPLVVSTLIKFSLIF
jgi:hypothetical protein